MALRIPCSWPRTETCLGLTTWRIVVRKFFHSVICICFSSKCCPLECGCKDNLLSSPIPPQCQQYLWLVLPLPMEGMSQAGVQQDTVSEDNLVGKMWLHWERLEKLLLLLLPKRRAF